MPSSTSAAAPSESPRALAAATHSFRAPRRFWAELSTGDFRHLDAERTVAVLPVAATEQHGPHLPLCVDSTIVDGLVAAVLQRLPAESAVLFLPTLAIGKSNEHGAFPGTLTLSAHTLIDAWMGLGASVAAAGVRKLVIFNAHGGQSALMDVVSHDLRERHALMVFAVNWYRLGLPAGLVDANELRFGIHGGEIETSLMLALAPHLVDMTQAADFDSSLRRLAATRPLLGHRGKRPRHHRLRLGALRTAAGRGGADAAVDAHEWPWQLPLVISWSVAL
jgi:creatinine amidohydrolase